MFAYSGLVAVFLCALTTRRGNSASAITALAVGFLVVLALQTLAGGSQFLVPQPLTQRAHAVSLRADHEYSGRVPSGSDAV